MQHPVRKNNLCMTSQDNNPLTFKYDKQDGLIKDKIK